MSNRNKNSELKPDVVLMCGISGSGKTTYARTLEQQGYLRLSVDQAVWLQHGAAFAGMPEERRAEIFSQANSEMLIHLERALAEGRNVVVDTTLCRRSKRDTIRRLCYSFGVTPRLIYMKADYDVLAGRLALRNGTGPDDQIVTPGQLDFFIKGFEEPRQDENPTIITQK